MVIIRIVTVKDATKLVRCLRDHNYGVTSFYAQGAEGPVEILFSIIKRQNLEHVIALLKQYNPQAFYSVEDVRFASEGIFPETPSVFGIKNLQLYRPYRKAK